MNKQPKPHSQLSTLHSPFIKEGYKQTEVGVIPEDWETDHLGCLSKISAGGTPSRSRQDYWDGDIPWITTTEVNGGDIRYANQFITKKGLDNSATKYLPKGTLLLALYGQGKTRGKVGLLSFKATINQACAAIQINRKISNRFVFYYLSYQYAAIRELSNSGSQDNLNSSIVKSIILPLPPTLAEQEAIAEALSDADSLIESIQQLIAKKRLIKQGAMQELLSPKEGWVEKTLSAVCDIKSGGTPSTTRSDYWDGEIIWCTPTDITKLKGFKYITETSRTITNLGLKSSSAEVVPPYSLIMTTRATIGECAINLEPITTNQGFKNLSPKEGSNIDFLYYLIATEKNNLITLCSGSTFLEISKKQVEEFTVTLPPLTEQTRIATILSDMDEEISTLETKLTKARQIKQGMMSELLTGKIRLV